MAKKANRVRPIHELSKEHAERVAKSDALRAANPNKKGPEAPAPKKLKKEDD